MQGHMIQILTLNPFWTCFQTNNMRSKWINNFCVCTFAQCVFCSIKTMWFYLFFGLWIWTEFRALCALGSTLYNACACYTIHTHDTHTHIGVLCCQPSGNLWTVSWWTASFNMNMWVHVVIKTHDFLTVRRVKLSGMATLYVPSWIH